jgi:hypothetical protein
MSENYISLKDIINRDVQKNKKGKYQIQSGENCNYAKINSFDKDISDICIFEKEIEDFNCSLIQYSLSDDDINNNNFIMIGYLIKNKNNTVIGSLDLIFNPKNKIKREFKKILKGDFRIILSNNNNEKKIIKTLDYYVGNNNIINLLTEILCEVLVEIINSN